MASLFVRLLPAKSFIRFVKLCPKVVDHGIFGYHLVLNGAFDFLYVVYIFGIEPILIKALLGYLPLFCG
jgi:hypothetical protein